MGSDARDARRHIVIITPSHGAASLMGLRWSGSMYDDEELNDRVKHFINNDRIFLEAPALTRNKSSTKTIGGLMSNPNDGGTRRW